MMELRSNLPGTPLTTYQTKPQKVYFLDIKSLPVTYNTSADPVNFLLNDRLWSSLGNRHICVGFKPSYDGGCWIKRIGRTAIPDRFPNGPTAGKVTLIVTDNKSRLQQLCVDVMQLTVATPWAKGQEVIAVVDPWEGHLLEVVQCKRKDDHVTVKTGSDSSRTFRLPKSEVCVVEKPKPGPV
jgi:hypothetical protein